MQGNGVAKETSRGALIHPAGIYYNRITGHQWARREGLPAVVVARSTQPHPFLLRFLGVEVPPYDGSMLKLEPDISREEMQLIEDAIGRMPLWGLLWMQSSDVSMNLLCETLHKAVFDRRRELALSETKRHIKKRAPRKWEKDRAVRMECVAMAKSQYEQTGRIDWDSIFELGGHTYPESLGKRRRIYLQNYVTTKLRELYGIRISGRKKLSSDES
jgi:hypothetical protein